MEAREQLRLINKRACHGGEHLVPKDAEIKRLPTCALAHPPTELTWLGRGEATRTVLG